jgi:hypothetical protein
MKNIYFFLNILLILLVSNSVNGQSKGQDILTEISEEVNQDSLSSYILSMQNLGTRYALADNRKEVALWIKQKFESFGYQDVILDSFLLDLNNYNLMQYNVICRSDSIYDHDDYVLIGAHHDAITYSNPMDSTPGADDNASGVAAVLEAARILKMHGENTKVPFHFATWAAEEQGLHGSKDYVQKHLATGTLPMFYLNLDMIANSVNGNRKVNYAVSGGLNYLLNIASQYSEIEPVSASNGGGSDHMPFTSQRVPILYFAENNFSEHYHSDQDRLENLEMDYATEVVKATVSAFYFGANAMPLVDVEQVINAGNGDDFIVTWSMQNDAIGYKLDVYYEDNLIQSLETTGDSLYVDGLPSNQDVCFELYGISSDSIGGFRLKRCIDLSEMPDPLLVSSEMNLQTIQINWSDLLPLDANQVIIERKQDSQSEFELYDEVAAEMNVYEILNHEPGIWEYRLSLKDTGGLVSESQSTFIFSTEAKNDIMIVSGQLGGYGNPTHSDVFDFYSDIMPLKDYYLFAAATQSKYLPIMTNMEVVIWNAFSSNYSEFYENIDHLKTYLENGGKLILFGKKPQLHLDALHPNGVPFDESNWVYNMGISDILENNGAKLKQILHTSGASANVDPEKLSASFNGMLPDIDALVTNTNASVVMTYQSLSGSAPINNFDDEPIAIKYDNGNATFIICGVPLYYFDVNESKILLKKLLEDEMMVGNTGVALPDNVVEIYPNPIENTIHIKNQMNENLNGVFTLSDISGRVVYQFQLDIESGDVSEINFDLLPGVYFLSNTQYTIKKKLIVE